MLILGDCLEVMGTLPAASVDAVVTDPPYGIGYEHGNQSESGRSSAQVEWGSIAGDEAPDGRWLREAYRVMKDGAAIYLCTRWDVEPEWRSLLSNAGFRLKQRLTWHKGVGGKGDIRGTYAPTCEDVLFASKGRHRLYKRPPSLLDVGCVPTWERRFHPHQKPIALASLLIRASTRPGDVVADFFMGSGSTGVACIKAGRTFIGIESNASYFAAAERRITDAQSATPLFTHAGATPLFDGGAA